MKVVRASWRDDFHSKYDAYAIEIIQNNKDIVEQARKGHWEDGKKMNNIHWGETGGDKYKYSSFVPHGD